MGRFGHKFWHRSGVPSSPSFLAFLAYFWPFWPNIYIFGAQSSLWCQGTYLQRRSVRKSWLWRNVSFGRKQEQIKDKAEAVNPGFPICFLTIRFWAVHANPLERVGQQLWLLLWIWSHWAPNCCHPPHLTPSLGQMWCLPSLPLIFPAANKGKQWLLPALMKSPVIYWWKIQCKCKECNYYYQQEAACWPQSWFIDS